MSSIRKFRFLLAILLILISVSILCWGIVPLGYETNTLTILPGEMELPTPSSFLPVLIDLV